MGKRYLKIQNVAMASNGTVYPVTLPQGIRSYTMKLRSNTEFKLGADSALSTYITYPSGVAETEDDVFSEASIVLYVQSEIDNDVMEVKTWE